MHAKKVMLKKMVQGKKIGKSPTGASPFKLDNGLGRKPLKPSAMGSGNGSNLGTSRVF